jgi:hypothetical protein
MLEISCDLSQIHSYLININERIHNIYSWTSVFNLFFTSLLLSFESFVWKKTAEREKNEESIKKRNRHSELRVLLRFYARR